jgi:hypothetical protein
MAARGNPTGRRQNAGSRILLTPLAQLLKQPLPK